MTHDEFCTSVVTDRLESDDSCLTCYKLQQARVQEREKSAKILESFVEYWTPKTVHPPLTSEEKAQIPLRIGDRLIADSWRSCTPSVADDIRNGKENYNREGGE